MATTILREGTEKGRAAVIEKWAGVADVCKGLHNFNTVLEIVSAFGRTPVYRLRKTWDRISKQVTAPHLRDFLIFSLSFVSLIEFYYIFKCGLHFLAMLKIFQRIILACFFSIFQFEFSACFTEFKIISPIVDVARVLQRVASLASSYKYPNPFSVRDTTIFVIFFSKFFQTA